jgi:hypothetical protein
MLKAAFKLGVAERLAELGMAPSDLDKLFNKSAASAVESAAKALAGPGKWLLGAALATPWALGFAGGFGAGAGYDVTQDDIEYAKQKALLDEYDYAIKRLKHSTGKKQLPGQTVVFPKKASDSAINPTAPLRPIQPIKPIETIPQSTPTSGANSAEANIARVKNLLSRPVPAPGIPVPTPSGIVPNPSV